MDIFTRIKQGNWTAYRLSKQSGIPLTTVADFLSRKSDPYKLSFKTAKKLADVLGLSLDELYHEIDAAELNRSYDVLRSDICHALKEQGDVAFLQALFSSDEIEQLYKRRLYFHCYYLLGLADYLCRIHDLPLAKEYEEIRTKKLRDPVVPIGLKILKEIDPKNPKISAAESKAIPEFARFNIYEGDVRDVA